MTTSSRTTTRTIRIPIEVDDEAVQFGKETGISNTNTTYTELVKTALRAFKYSKEIEEKPDKKSELRGEFERFLDKVRTTKYAEELFSNLSDETVEIILLACHNALQTRQKQRKLEEAETTSLIQARRNYNPSHPLGRQ